MPLVSQEEARWQYGTALGWRLLIYLTTPPLIAGLGYWAFRFLREAPGKAQPLLAYGPAVLLLAGALFLVYALLEVIRWRLVLTPTRIISAGLLRTRELALDHVRGYRTDDHYTYILPRWDGQPTIKIGYTTAGYAELQALLAEHFPRLNDADILNEASILADASLGVTEQQRAAKLQAARRVATALNVAGAVVAAWLLLRPVPYQPAVAAGLLLPLLVVAALWRYQGLLWINDEKNSPYPSVGMALLLPTPVLALRALLDGHVVSYQPLWPVAGGVAALMGLALLGGSQAFLQRRATRVGTIVGVGLATALYGFGATTTANVAFDATSPTVFRVRVLGKYERSGKMPTFHLTVAPWGPFRTRQDVTVKYRRYTRTAVGSHVAVELRAGALGIPWYGVAE